MFEKQPWLRAGEDLGIERRQCWDEGIDTTVLDASFDRIEQVAGEEREREAVALFARISALPMRSDYPYVEPIELEDALAQREVCTQQPMQWARDQVVDRIHGGWLGRCAGCLLGQPVEWWTRERLRGLLEATGNWPMSRYIASDIPQALRDEFSVVDEGRVYGSNRINWINNVDGMPEDDDTNYTILALKLLEERGRGFTPEDVAEAWLNNLPVLHTCTAERVAYKNLLNLIPPPESASVRNPYREWIGAQIRADLYGYINPGQPQMAAEMAWRDACISHTKNGIYGAMFVAAMIAAAFALSDPEAVVLAGLSQIPKRSRLHEGVSSILAAWRGGATVEQMADAVHARWDQRDPHSWTHVIPNAMIVAASLLGSGGDFGRGVGDAVSCGFDTDCNGATVGSILGVMLGAKRLPEAWTAPLRDSVRSGVDGFACTSIAELAARTARFVEAEL